MANGVVSSFLGGRTQALQEAAARRRETAFGVQQQQQAAAARRAEQLQPFKTRALQQQEDARILQQKQKQAEFDRFTEKGNLESMVQGALQFQNITDPVEQDAFLTKRIKDIQARGGDARDTIELLETPFEQRMQVAKNVINTGERFGIIKPPPITKQKTLAKPIVGVNAEGKKAFFRTDETGNLVEVPGAVPPPGSKETIRMTPDGGVEIIKGEVGVVSGLPKKITAKLQEKIIANENNLMQLDRIGKQFVPEYLTFGGQFTAAKLRLKSKAGFKLTAKESLFLRNRRKFTQNVNQLFNKYKHEITGAAASISELKGLKDSMLNPDLSPEEFQGAYDEFREGLLRSNRLSRRILREGIKGSFGKNLDRLFTAGEDDDIEARGAELRSQGLNDEQIGDALIREGF